MSLLWVDTDELDEGARVLRGLITQLGYHGPHNVSSCGSGLVAGHVADAAGWLTSTGVTSAMKAGRLADGLATIASSFVSVETNLVFDAKSEL